MDPAHALPSTPTTSAPQGVWSASEHERFLEAMLLYPRGPWRAITNHVGTRSIKQVQTHGQKYQQKLLRHQRGLLKQTIKLMPNAGHRVDAVTVEQFTSGCILRRPRTAPAVEEPASATASSVSPRSPGASLDDLLDSEHMCEVIGLAETPVVPAEWRHTSNVPVEDSTYSHQFEPVPFTPILPFTADDDSLWDRAELLQLAEMLNSTT